jgi:serine/threonine-protein kinase RsbW
MTAEATLTAKNELSELERLSEFLSRFWADNHLPAELEFNTNLALEEVFANVVLHGYRDSDSHEISVHAAVGDGTVTLTVEDDGIAFNPLDAPAADITQALEDRPVGGLGIHLIRSLMTEVAYARVDGRNRLEMKKKIGESK